MPIRTTRETVTFERPFVLGDFKEVLPAGDYSVETDEERLQGISFPVYQRVRAVITLHPTDAAPGRSRTLIVMPSALDAARDRDRAAVAGPPAQPADGAANGAARLDRRAVERGENEGMALPGRAGTGVRRRHRLTQTHRIRRQP